MKLEHFAEAFYNPVCDAVGNGSVMSSRRALLWEVEVVGWTVQWVVRFDTWRSVDRKRACGRHINGC